MLRNFDCPNCNQPVKSNEIFCPHCGKRIIYPKGEEFVQQEESVEEQRAPYLGYLEERSFLKWFLISFFTLSIGGYVYLYFSMKDLEKIDIVIQDPMRGSSSRRSGSDNCVACDICCLFIGVYFYHLYNNFMKFRLFRSFLLERYNKERKVYFYGPTILISKIVRSISILLSIFVGIFQWTPWDFTTWITFQIVVWCLVLISTVVINVQLGLWQRAYNQLAKEQTIEL